MATGGVDVKLGVTGINNFKRDMAAAEQKIKTLKAAMDENEESFKAGGDAQIYFEQKVKLAKQQMTLQKSVVEKGEAALKAMKENGVDPSSTAFQTMQQKVINARTTLIKMDTQLKSTEDKEKDTKTEANNLATAVESIGKKQNLDAIEEGLNKVSSATKTAVRKVTQLGKKLWGLGTDSAKWADEELTLADTYGIDVETLQRMQNAAELVDVSVEDMLNAKDKLSSGMKYGSSDVQKAFEDLGVATKDSSGDFRNAEDVFWDVGEAINQMANETDKEATAQKLLGKSWKELQPLFNKGKAGYESLLADQDVVSEEDVKRLGEFDDALKELENSWNTLKKDAISSLAPAMTELASALTEFTSSDLAKDVVSGMIDALKWLVENKALVIGAIGAVGVELAALKVSESVISVMKAWNGIKTFLGNNTPTGTPVVTPTGTPTGTTTGTPTVTPTGTTTGGGIRGALTSPFAGMIGLQLITTGAIAAAYERNTNKNIRGSEGYMDLSTGGDESLKNAFIDYVQANKAVQDMVDSGEYDETKANELLDAVDATTEALQGMEGYADLWEAYSAWRQENSLGNEDWQLPDSWLESYFGDVSTSGKDMKDAAGEISEAAAGIEGAAENGVRKGISGVKITLDGYTVGKLVAPYVSDEIVRAMN